MNQIELDRYGHEAATYDRAQAALREAADNLGPETARRINAALSSIPGDDFATDADRVVHLLDPAAVQFEDIANRGKDFPPIARI